MRDFDPSEFTVAFEVISSGGRDVISDKGHDSASMPVAVTTEDCVGVSDDFGIVDLIVEECLCKCHNVRSVGYWKITAWHLLPATKFRPKLP